MDIKSHYILQKESFNTSKKKEKKLKKKSKRYYMYLGYRQRVGFLTLWLSSGSSKYNDKTNYSQEKIGLGQ
jgi:hypothetical protein